MMLLPSSLMLLVDELGGNALLKTFTSSSPQPSPEKMSFSHCSKVVLITTFDVLKSSPARMPFFRITSFGFVVAPLAHAAPGAARASALAAESSAARRPTAGGRPLPAGARS